MLGTCSFVHYLHAVFVEHIEGIPVQVRVDPIHALGLVAINVDFVGDAEVPERLLQDEGLGRGPQTRRHPH